MVLLLNVALNLAKFGTLFDLPADRQLLSLQNPARAAWFAGNDGSFFSPRFLPTTVVQYLRPDALRFERLVPFVRFGPLATELGSYPLEANTPASSLPASATLLFVLAIARRVGDHSAPIVAAAGRCGRVRLPQRRPASSSASSPTATSPTCCRRSSFRPPPPWPSVALPAWAAGVGSPVGSVVVLVRVGRMGQRLAGDLDPEPQGARVHRDALRHRRRRLRWRSPVGDRSGAGQSTRRATASSAIDGECDGLYIAEQKGWVPLELAGWRSATEGHR